MIDLRVGPKYSLRFWNNIIDSTIKLRDKLLVINKHISTKWKNTKYLQQLEIHF